MKGRKERQLTQGEREILGQYKEDAVINSVFTLVYRVSSCEERGPDPQRGDSLLWSSFGVCVPLLCTAPSTTDLWMMLSV